MRSSCGESRGAPLLLVVAAMAGWTSLCASYYTDTPTDTMEPLAVTFSCEERWCNESWRGDRILRYNLSVSYELRAESRTQHSGPVLNCMGGQVSTNCVLEGSGTAITEELARVVNRTLVSVEDLGAEGLIVTDNFNRSLGELQGSYGVNQDKIWQIRIPQSCQLWIVFEEFDLEATGNCDKDYFSVQTSKNQRNIRKYCKSLESISIQRRRRAQLWFHSDDSVRRRGIFASYCFRRIATNSSQQLRCDCNLGGSHTRRRRRRRRSTSERVQSVAIERGTRRNNGGQSSGDLLVPYTLGEMAGHVHGHSTSEKQSRHHHQRTRNYI